MDDYEGYTLYADEWTDLLRELADLGYCHCIYYNGKHAVIYVFDNKTMEPGKYHEKYYDIANMYRPDYRVRISVNNGKTSGWF